MLESNNFDIHFAPFLDSKTWYALYKEGGVLKKITGIIRSFYRRLITIIFIYKYDYVFIHREVSHLGPPIFEFIIAKIFRKPYIYDFDDAIWLANYSESNAKVHRLKAYWKVKYCIKWAGQITVGNSYLANYARSLNNNVIIIPTTIDTLNYHNINTDYNQKIVIGWTGTHTTMRFLDFLVPIIKKLEARYDFEFRVISNQEPKYDLNSLRFIKWERNTEIQDLNQISIGVMPLEQDIWSEGKCGFKCLQYMSLGIPSVVSPVGVNEEIIQHGENGLIATTEIEWEKSLESLIQSIDLRKKIGLQGKETIKSRYSVLAFKKEYLNLFS
ncbi:glycosyltransferase family 4 protein [Crocinitomicaceae bacterium]|nr:glycosyltransferase family 4 protein [Crocinitomicaceae bacterium]